MKLQPGELAVLSNLLDELLDLPPEAHEAWLASLPIERAALATRLRDLMASGAAIETDEFMATLPKLLADVLPGFTPAPVHDGETVGPYRLVREIGSGGMSTVWLAERTDGVLKRPFALKLPHAGARASLLAERFNRERDILGALTHPNIARLYDAGVSDGQAYLAMEYVSGVPLPEFCNASRSTVRARLQLFLQVLRAVQFAHSQLVVHRDLKPTNILVTPEGQPMLLDFGIAKLITEGPADQTELTLHGGRAMTLAYASPEQIAGSPLGTGTDIYSLGVILFELLTGTRPYRLKRDSRAALEEAIATADPLRLGQCNVTDGAAAERTTTTRRLKAELGGDLDTILSKALKKDPADRYVTIDAFARDIQAYLAGMPVSARPDSPLYVARKFLARHAVPVAFGTAALTLIVAAAGVALVEAQTASRQRNQALKLAARNEAVSGFLQMLITDAVAAERPVSVQDMLARSEALAEAEFKRDPDQLASVLDVLGTHYHSTGEDVRSERLLQHALDITRQSGDLGLHARLLCDHAAALAGIGKPNVAIPVLEAVAMNRDTTDQQSAECYAYLSNIASDVNDSAGALRYAQASLQHLRQAPQARESLEASFLGNLGFAQHLIGRNDEAQRDYRLALDKLAAIGRERSPDAIAIRNNWAIVSDGAGNPLRALALYDETLRIARQNDPNESPPVYLLGNRARALELIGRFRDSADAYSQCVARATAPAQTAYCLAGLASAYRELGDLSAAEGYLTKLAATVGGNSPPGSPATLALAIIRGELALSRGRTADARAAFTTVIDAHRTTSAAVMALIDRADAYRQEGQPAAAAADAREALSIAQKQQGGEPYSVRSGLASLALAQALALMPQTDHRAALDASRAAVAHLSHTVDPTHPALLRAQRLLETLAGGAGIAA